MTTAALIVVAAVLHLIALFCAAMSVFAHFDGDPQLSRWSGYVAFALSALGIAVAVLA